MVAEQLAAAVAYAAVNGSVDWPAQVLLAFYTSR